MIALKKMEEYVGRHLFGIKMFIASKFRFFVSFCFIFSFLFIIITCFPTHLLHAKSENGKKLSASQVPVLDLMGAFQIYSEGKGGPDTVAYLKLFLEQGRKVAEPFLPNLKGFFFFPEMMPLPFF